MPVSWKLKEFLEGHKLTPYRLIKESGIPQGTVYRLVNGDTRSLNADILDLTLEALRALTGGPVEIQDVLEYRSAGDIRAPRLSAAGVPYTGDPETDAVLDDHPDILERIRKLEAGEVKLIPWEQVKAEQRAKRGL